MANTKPPSNKYTVKEHQTLCWTCRNAVPDKDWIYGCSWSRRLKPVEGWVAERTTKKPDLQSWKVIECPEYIPDGDGK